MTKLFGELSDQSIDLSQINAYLNVSMENLNHSKNRNQYTVKPVLCDLPGKH
jgi:hypothetical protein